MVYKPASTDPIEIVTRRHAQLKRGMGSIVCHCYMHLVARALSMHIKMRTSLHADFGKTQVQSKERRET